MICTTCGRDNADSLVFCEECGQRLKPRVAPATAPADAGIRAESGAPNGYAQHEKSSPPSGGRPPAPDLKLGPAVPRAASTACPVCGTVNPGDMRFCISCGTNLDKVRSDQAANGLSGSVLPVAPINIGGASLGGNSNTDRSPANSPSNAPTAIAIPQMRVVEIGPQPAQTSRTCIRCHGQNDPISNFCKFCGNALAESTRAVGSAQEPLPSSDHLGTQPSAIDHALAAQVAAMPAPAYDPIGASDPQNLGATVATSPPKMESLNRTRVDEGVVKPAVPHALGGPIPPAAGAPPRLASAAPQPSPQPAPVQLTPAQGAPALGLGLSPAAGGTSANPAFAPLGTHWGAQPSPQERIAFSGGTVPPEPIAANPQRGPTAAQAAFPAPEPRLPAEPPPRFDAPPQPPPMQAPMAAPMQAPPMQAPGVPPAPAVSASRPDPNRSTSPPVGRIVMVARDGRPGPDFSIVEQLDIGRTEGDVRIPEDPYLSPRHARLRSRDGQMWLQDLGSINGVYLRLSRIRTPRLESANAAHKPNEIVSLLHDQDLILAGQQVLRFELVRDGEAGFGPAVERGVHLFGTPSSKRHARLCQRAVEGTTLDVHYLRKHETVLGREQGDLIYGDDPFLSRRHAAVRVDGTMQDRRYYLVDMGSSNGTFLRMRSDTQVFDGDHFRVGHQLFRIEIFGARTA